MKQTFMNLLFAGIIFINPSSDKQSVNNAFESITKHKHFYEDGIVGTWKLTIEAYDDNNNTKLDDDERKAGIQNSTPQALRDYKMQFNSNGTCKIEGRSNGTYKLSQESDQRILTVQLEPREGLNGKQLPASKSRYHIKSLTSNELLLLAEVSGVTYTFWLFKKV